MVNVLLLVMASLVGPGEEGAVLTPSRIYHAVNRPLVVEVHRPPTFGIITVQLMTPQGTLIGEPAEVETGEIDLVSILPDVWTLRSTVYLQPLVRGKPVGPALVMQPMLSPMVPIAVPGQRPDGKAFMEVRGFEHEATHIAILNEQLDEWVGTITSTVPGSPKDTEKNAPQEQKPTVDAPPIPVPERRFTGFRTYVETDAIMQTTHGDIRIDLTPEHAPNTAWNFYQLASGGFYDGVSFHRIVPYDRKGLPFVIQAGDPSGTGEGGPGYWLPLEPSTLPHDLGVISMARDTPPDSAGSQFFICLSREGTARLDGQYCPFGYAIEGLEAIDAIAGMDLADPASGRPASPPVIQSVQFIAAPPRAIGTGRPDGRITRPVEVAEDDEKTGRVPR